jgi:hypothetical protein
MLYLGARLSAFEVVFATSPKIDTKRCVALATWLWLGIKGSPTLLFYKSRLLFVLKESASTSWSRKTKDMLGYDLIYQSAHKAEHKLEPLIGYSIWIAI